MLDQRKFFKRIARPPRPVAEEVLRREKRRVRRGIAGHHHCGVLRHEIPSLNEAHLVGGGRLDRFSCAERRLSRRILIKEPPVHFDVDRAVRIRQVAIDLAEHGLALLLEILRIERRVPRRVAQEPHRHGKIRRGRRHVVLALLLARRAVVRDAELVDGLHVIGAFGTIRFEEHVLVEMRQPVQLGRLGQRPVADGELDGDERDRVVFEDDHLQAVGKNPGHERSRLRQRS